MRTNHHPNEESPQSELIAIHQEKPDGGPELGMQDARRVSTANPAQPHLAERTRHRRAERRFRSLVISADYRMRDRVKHPDGGESSVAEIIKDETVQRAQIEDETASGSLKHQRLPRWIHWIPRYVLCFDFSLLLYFFAGITNVNWASALSMALGFAILLAAMVTSLSYGFLAFTGHRLRSHKNHAGTVHHDELDGFTRAAFGVAVGIIVVIAVLMFQRMRTELLYALGGEADLTALVIAGALTVVSAAANFLVIAIHALDGSDQVTRLDKLSAAARRPYAKAQRMKEEAAHFADQDR